MYGRSRPIYFFLPHSRPVLFGGLPAGQVVACADPTMLLCMMRFLGRLADHIFGSALERTASHPHPHSLPCSHWQLVC